MWRRNKVYRAFSLILLMSLTISFRGNAENKDPASDQGAIKDIKSYCIDFNWGTGRKAGFAKPGTWKDADPKVHVDWYKAVGANVIQTFAVSCNGYAWYKSKVIPEQPGLKHDFLTEVVKLGHAEGMKVMGYFCIGSNTRWGKENPELSYGTPSSRHIPYTDEYLAYLSSAITDAVKTTGIDGFMIDWVWMPSRKKMPNGTWIEAEKKLYEKLMGEPFPGEDKLNKQQDLEYSRKAIDRCWKTIRKAAKGANPNCIIWLTTNNTKHPHVINSDMYKEVDWLMGETGKLEEILKLKSMVGKHTRLITCMSDFGGSDATKQVPEAIKAGVGLYGYAKPRSSNGTIDLTGILPKQLTQLYGNAKRIAVLARAYRGKSIDAVWRDGDFFEPQNPPPFRAEFRSRRGFPDTAVIDFEDGKATITVRNPYQSGRCLLTRVGKWPARIVVRSKRIENRKEVTDFRAANGTVGVSIIQKDGIKAMAGEWIGKLDLKKSWSGEHFLNGGKPESPIKIDGVEASKTEEIVEFVLPVIITESNPSVICFEWGIDGRVR